MIASDVPEHAHAGMRQLESPPLRTSFVSAIVSAALQAPSGDNCQPWRFRWDGRRLRVYFDPARAESFYDVDNRASWIALGAVLENMQLAAAPLGLSLSIELFPAAEVEPIVAVVTPQPSTPVPMPLAEAIETRCVNRRAYQRRALPADVRADIEAVVSAAPAAHLSWIDAPPAKKRLAALAAENDRLLFEHRALHDGVYRWLRWTAAEAAKTGDGMPIATLELHPLERPGFRLAAWWPFARALAAIGASRAIPLRSRRVYERSAAIALLTVDSSAREEFVRGGRLMQRIWLTATRHHVAFQPITGITFLLLRLSLLDGDGLSTRHRERLHRIADEAAVILPKLNDAVPIMLFRLGVAAAPSARARRLPINDVFTIDER